MKVLMLSQDMKLFEEGSPVALRVASYGSVADLTLVVFGVGAAQEKILAPNVRVTCAGGTNKLDAYRAGVHSMSSLAKGSQFDLLSSQDPFFIGLAGLIVARAHSIPFQAQVHTDCFSYAYTLQSLRNCIETLLAFFVIQGATCVRVVSHRVQKSIESFSQIPATVLPIRLSELPAGISEKPAEFSNRFTLLSVARMSEEKQLHLIIDAVAVCPGVNVIFVGDGPRKDELMLRAKRLGVAERVTFTGWKNPEPYYAHASAFVSVSRFEGYGLSIMEAALHGLPILSTDAGVAGDVLQDGEEVVLVKANAGSVALALQKIITDDAFRTKIAAGARKKAEGELVSESEYLERYGRALRSCAVKKAS